MKQLWKIPFVALLAVFTLVSFSFTANAAEKLPYEYEFEVTNVDKVEYNGFEGVKQMVITFEKNIPNAFNENEIKLFQGDDEILNIIDGVTKNGNVVTVTFKNLEFLNPSGEGNPVYEIKIGKDANVVTAQLKSYTLPFYLHEILPGFASVFIEGSADKINSNIFKHSPPRDVSIHIPPAYLTKIETIHRYKGVVEPQKDGPALTNIDVFADPEAARMKAWIGNKQYNASDSDSRDLDYRTDIKGFSMGQAGIEALVCNEEENKTNPCDAPIDDFHLRAYDTYGKVLTNRSFKVKVNNETTDFKINDYIKTPAKVFGTTENLYRLMEDTKLLEDIITQIPVEELDKLGVTYKLGSSIKVDSAERLEKALENDYFRTIELTKDIELSEIPGDTLFVNRNVAISGGKLLGGHVELGEGTNDITVQLKDIEITGTLTIDVGENGTVILDNVTGNPSVNIISAGTNSIYLFNFITTNGILLENITPLRIVTSDIIEDKLTISGSGVVTLEGSYQDIEVTTTTELIIKNNTTIGNLAVADGEKLKVDGFSYQVNNPSGDITFKIDDPSITPPIVGAIEPQTTNLADWESLGKEIPLDNMVNKGMSVSLEGIDNWKIKEHDFGNTANIEWNNDNQERMLIIKNLNPEAAVDIVGVIVLQGELDGKIYEVTIPIIVKVDADEEAGI